MYHFSLDNVCPALSLEQYHKNTLASLIYYTIGRNCSSLNHLGQRSASFWPCFRTVWSHYTDSECWQKVRTAWVRPHMWELAPFLSCWYLSGYLQQIQNCPNLNAVWPKLASRGSTFLRTHCLQVVLGVLSLKWMERRVSKKDIKTIKSETWF